MTGYLCHGLAAGCRCALLAFGFGLVYQTAGVFHFAHGAAYALGGYAWWLLLSRAGCPWWLAAPPAVLLAAGTGWLVEVVGYRPLRRRGAGSEALFLTSLAVYTATASLLAVLCGHDQQPVPVPNPCWDVAGTGAREAVVVSAVELTTIAVAVAVFGAIWWLLARTPFGLRTRAYAANPLLAEALGVDTHRLLAQIGALGAALSGLAALCVAADVGVSPAMGLEAVVVGAVAVVVGGLGSLPGVGLAGLLLGLLRHSAAYMVGTRWEDVLVFALLLAVLLWRPRGLCGVRG